MNWRDLKPGDLVRVTFEAPVWFVGKSSICITLDPADDETETRFTDTEADAAKWELLPKPLKIGRAKHWPSGRSCQVLAIHEGLAWIKYDRGGYETISAHHFENINEEPSHDHSDS